MLDAFLALPEYNRWVAITQHPVHIGSLASYFCALGNNIKLCPQYSYKGYFRVYINNREIINIRTVYFKYAGALSEMGKREALSEMESKVRSCGVQSKIEEHRDTDHWQRYSGTVRSVEG